MMTKMLTMKQGRSVFNLKVANMIISINVLLSYNFISIFHCISSAHTRENSLVNTCRKRDGSNSNPVDSWNGAQGWVSLYFFHSEEIEWTYKFVKDFI